MSRLVQGIQLCPEGRLSRLYALAASLGTKSEVLRELAAQVSVQLPWSAAGELDAAIVERLSVAWSALSQDAQEQLAAKARSRAQAKKADEIESDRRARAQTDIRYRDVVDVAAAAALVGVKPNTIRQWERRGAITRVPGRPRVAFFAADVRSHAASTEQRARRISKDEARAAQSPDDALTLLEIAVDEALQYGVDVLPHVKRILDDRRQDRFR